LLGSFSFAGKGNSDLTLPLPPFTRGWLSFNQARISPSYGLGVCRVELPNFAIALGIVQIPSGRKLELLLVNSFLVREGVKGYLSLE
jgi:hypothetical protein